MQGLYRNHMDEVIRFFETHHQVYAAILIEILVLAPYNFSCKEKVPQLVFKFEFFSLSD